MTRNTSPARAAASRENGKLGGRPKGRTPAKAVQFPASFVDRVDAAAGGPRKRVRWIMTKCEQAIKTDK